MAKVEKLRSGGAGLRDAMKNDSRGTVDAVAVGRRVMRTLVPAQHRPAVAGAIRSLRYRGSQVHCPCCNGNFTRFIPFADRPHAQCPRCEALERHRLVLLFLGERTDLLPRPCSLLHVAPEYAVQKALRRQRDLRYLSVDLESPLAMDHADLLELPYADSAFDAVLCSHVLEHVEDDHRALLEILRVLRPGGQAIILSPIDQNLAETLEDPAVTAPAERLRVFGQADHLRRYGRDFAERVEAAGFAVTTIQYLESFDAGQIARLGLRRDSDLFQRDDIFLCVKSPEAARGSGE
jgi:SAM-dependent methyltransferase